MSPYYEIIDREREPVMTKRVSRLVCPNCGRIMGVDQIKIFPTCPSGLINTDCAGCDTKDIFTEKV